MNSHHFQSAGAQIYCNSQSGTQTVSHKQPPTSYLEAEAQMKQQTDENKVSGE